MAEIQTRKIGKEVEFNQGTNTLVESNQGIKEISCNLVKGAQFPLPKLGDKTLK